MCILIPDSPARSGLSSPASREKPRTDMTRSAELTIRSDSTADHDAALLVAALEVIESRRAAIQWLLEADLLSLCLV